MLPTNLDFPFKIRAWISGAPMLGKHLIVCSACAAAHVVMSGVAVQTDDSMLLVAVLELMVALVALTRSQS